MKSKTNISETEQKIAKKMSKRLAELLVSADNRIKKLEEALKYCANYAHPSIVQDVAKEALEE